MHWLTVEINIGWTWEYALRNKDITLDAIRFHIQETTSAALRHWYNTGGFLNAKPGSTQWLPVLYCTLIMESIFDGQSKCKIDNIDYVWFKKWELKQMTLWIMWLKLLQSENHVSNDITGTGLVSHFQPKMPNQWPTGAKCSSLDLPVVLHNALRNCWSPSICTQFCSRIFLQFWLSRRKHPGLIKRSTKSLFPSNTNKPDRPWHPFKAVVQKKTHLS